MTILVTGGAGFIGSNFVHVWLRESNEQVVNLDKLTYAGNSANLDDLASDPRHVFVRGDVCDQALVDDLLTLHQPRAIVHFAAESHVDRSIDRPEEFLQTNIIGTYNLLQAVRAFLAKQPAEKRAAFRFLHVSTDEVYGALTPDDPPFRETNQYQPNSPYSASKAASDHLVRAWHHTFGVPVVTTNCSNNYGPYQFPEKLMPLVLLNALAGKPLPIYGDGQQVRDWLYVEDHCRGIMWALEAGRPGETYNIGGNCERANIEVVRTICAILDTLRPRAGGGSYSEQITFVKDRPGHDRRYAIDARKIQSELNWRPQETFETGMLKTVEWYLAHETWTESVQSGAYRHWIAKQYGQ